MNSLESTVNAGDSAVDHAPNQAAARVSKRGVSDAALRAAKPAEKAYKIAAGGGLYLEVMPGGSKLWRWKYRLLGKENRYALGGYPDLSLKEARETQPKRPASW